MAPDDPISQRFSLGGCQTVRGHGVSPVALPDEVPFQFSGTLLAQSGIVDLGVDVAPLALAKPQPIIHREHPSSGRLLRSTSSVNLMTSIFQFLAASRLPPRSVPEGPGHPLEQRCQRRRRVGGGLYA